MKTLEQSNDAGSRAETLADGRWVRVRGTDQGVLHSVRDTHGIDLAEALPGQLSTTSSFSTIAVTFAHRDQATFRETSLLIAVGDNTVITLEPEGGCPPLDLAIARMERDGREDDTVIEITASILESIADTTDELVTQLSAGAEQMMTETRQILHSLETKKSREFGVSDVTATQQQLADMEELLSYCMESQLVLAEAARQLRALARDRSMQNRTDLGRIIEDVEAIEPHIDFVHGRVRLLQQTNNLALNVKQNQIIKVFSVVTAVFLPVMLLSTYYSMNFENMPILSWQYAEPALIVLSFFFAMLPLMYVRKKGWLR